MVRTGDAIALTSSGEHFDLFAYNDHYELIGSTGYFGNDPGQSGNPMTSIGRDLDYSYDPIGNRTDSIIDQATPTTYTANNLNQYTATANPAESFDYDEDGNLSQDEVYVFKYDCENRLAAVAQDLWPDHNILEFTYDYRGRRVRKVEYWPYLSEFSGIKKDVRFVYDGWNVLMELDGENDNEVLKKYAWGLDLSGTLQGAGGIGGLLANEETAGTIETSDDLHHFYFYDGNGNVGQLIDWSGTPGTIAAHYEYDPYGNALVSAGAYAAANPFRFSTKYFDAETGLYNYGHRFYSPRLGRWLNRDPIGESGGLGLYSFIQNGPANGVDSTGLTFTIRFCKKWTRPDGTVLDLSSLVVRGIRAACDQLRALRLELDTNPQFLACMKNPPDPGAALNAKLASDEIGRIIASACIGGREIQCRCDKQCAKQTGNLLTPWPYRDQPIYVCTNNIRNPELILLDPNNWIHEFQRWWTDDTQIGQWDRFFSKAQYCLDAIAKPPVPTSAPDPESQ